MAQAKTGFTVQAEEEGRRGTTVTVPDIDAAVSAAWALQRHLEGPVEIVKHEPDGDIVVGRLYLEWLG